MALAHLTLTLPLAIWMLMTYFRSLPDRGRPGGDARRRHRSRRSCSIIIVPMSRPMLASVAIIVFIFSWNEFLLAFILTSRNAQTVPVAVASARRHHDLRLAADRRHLGLLDDPGLLFVGFAQRHIVTGLASGAVK